MFQVESRILIVLKYSAQYLNLSPALWHITRVTFPNQNILERTSEVATQMQLSLQFCVGVSRWTQASNRRSFQLTGNTEFNQFD